MAEGPSTSHPLGVPPERQVSRTKGPGKAGMMETLDIYMKLAKDCVEAVQGMPSPKFNNEQCGYLVEKLEAVVESASLFLENSQAQPNGTYSLMDVARWVETFKLLSALAKQVEGFFQGCCKEAWIQAAMTLVHVAEYVSSLGFNLELCKIALRKEPGVTESVTLDEVGKMNRDEVETVEKRALIDAESLLKKATLELNSSNAKDCNLAKYLLHRLVGVGPNPTSDDDSVLVKLFEWVTSGRKAEQLGRGASAKVYKVMWLGTPVAKKTFDGPENQEFLQEVRVLSQLSHPNITSMFCCNMNKRNCSIIMELMDGNLHDLMQSRLEECSDSPPFSILEGVDIMLQVGEGVKYLHGKRIEHRDLKSMNILVKSVEASDVGVGYVQVKVVDFGLSKTKERSMASSAMTYNVGTFRWMAPEVISLVGSNQRGRGGHGKLPKHNFKCDIYSFAMVCYEILTGELPFQCEGTSIEIKKKVLEGLRPELPDYCPSMLRKLIEKCWSKEPGERPTIGDVCSELKYVKYLLMTSKMFQECFILHMKEPFEVVHLNINNLPWAKQVQMNISSPFLKELLLDKLDPREIKKIVSIDGPHLFHSYEKVMERRVYCRANVEALKHSSGTNARRNEDELEHITHLLCFMDKEFGELKLVYRAMEMKRHATWEMLWAFFPPGERVAYFEDGNSEHLIGDVLRTDYKVTQDGPMLLIEVAKWDSNMQTQSIFFLNKILHWGSPRKKKTLIKDTHMVTVPAFEGDRGFLSLDILPIRFFEATKTSFFPHQSQRFDQKQMQRFGEEWTRRSNQVEPIAAQQQLSIEEIKRVTKNFGSEFLIHNGLNSMVYYAPLQDRVVAIEILYGRATRPEAEVLSLVSVVSKLKHENVVEPLGYYLDGQHWVLAYEYATMGSLKDILHGRIGVKGAQPGLVLDWMQRVKIAIGAAKGLQYLHEARPPVIHGKVKSSNILIFDSYLTKIIYSNFLDGVLDFKELPNKYDYRHFSYFIENFEYRSPECILSGSATEKSDIFSFGVVLLELLTGRRPNDHTVSHKQRYLTTWARPRLSADKVHKIVDPKLGSEYPAKAVEQLAVVAALCIQDEAGLRPDMSFVVNGLERLLLAQYSPQAR